MIRIFGMVLGLLLVSTSLAQTSVNTMGSDDSTAISGYDTVAFHTHKKPLRGDPKWSYVYAGAKWLFATEENLRLFEANPERYAPAWGGHCAWAVPRNSLSRKRLSGDFAIIDGRLYLFSFGNNQRSGARDDFLYGRYPASMSIRDGDRLWPELHQRLLDGSLSQATSSDYTRSRFEESK